MRLFGTPIDGPPMGVVPAHVHDRHGGTRFPVAAMARVLGVSKAGYYAWTRRLPSARAEADAALLARVRTIHATSRETYGSPRIHAELREAGEPHGRKRMRASCVRPAWRGPA